MVIGSISIKDVNAIILTFDSSGYTFSLDNNNDVSSAKINVYPPISYGIDDKNWEKLNLYCEDAWYYFRNDIALKGWNEINNNKSYFYPYSGTMITGWQSIGSASKGYYLYYLSPNNFPLGAMYVGTRTIDNLEYTFNDNGQLNYNNGWLEANNYLSNGSKKQPGTILIIVLKC